MGIKLTKNASQKQVPALEPGKYKAVCTGVIDIGIHVVRFDEKERETPQILLMFDLIEVPIEINGQRQYKRVQEIFNISTNRQSNLVKFLESWRGQAFQEDGIEGFDLGNVLGVPALIELDRKKTKDDKTINPIIGITSADFILPDDLELQLFDIDETNTWQTYIGLPLWVQKLINKSETMKQRGSVFESDEKDVWLVEVQFASEEESKNGKSTKDLPF